MPPEVPTILIVDDVAANLLALEAVLEPLRLHIVKASSGAEALKFLLKGDCSLILLDVQMPDLDGFETATMIRARERTRYTPIIFVTAVHREEAHIVKGYTRGAVDYLVKPLEATVLLAKVRVFLEQYTREQGLQRETQMRKRERDDFEQREKSARQESEEQRQHLHALFMQAPAAIAILDGPQRIFALANPRIEALIGRGPLVGRRARDVMPEPAASATWDVLDRVFVTGEPFLGNEVAALFGLDGRLFNFVAQPTRAGGRVTGVMVHAVEVTETVLAHQRTAELAKQLQQAGRGKDEFLAMLGHELRNPLAPILTALHLMQRRSNAAESERERAIIERQVKHLSRLVDDLLDVSRATMGKIDLRREPLEVATAVARAVEVAAPQIESRQHELTVTVPGAGLLVAGDPVRLAQVLANLLNNAAKYTEPGGHIAVDGRREGAEVVISVRDDGRGIAPDRLPAMFELFVQGDQAADRSQGGLGIGLTLVRSLVQLHGGRVDARSGGLGKGSEFVVRLPALELVTAPVFAIAPPPSPPAGPAIPCRVLVVDDNKDAAEMLALALRQAGHEVHEEHDGLAAMVTAARFRPDVVLLDLGLPGVDGFEVARRMRADAQLANVRIVAITGYGRDDDRRRTREVGIDRHLVKPVDLETIVETIGVLQRSPRDDRSGPA